MLCCCVAGLCGERVCCGCGACEGDGDAVCAVLCDGVGWGEACACCDCCCVSEGRGGE